MEIIQTTALITINETLVVVLISFLIFLFIMNRIMFRPLVRTMDRRQAHMERLKQEIGELRRKVLGIKDLLADRERQVKADARRFNEEAIRAGQGLAASLITDTRTEIAGFLQGSMRQVASKLAKERQEIRLESEIIAEKILEKVIGRRPE